MNRILIIIVFSLFQPMSSSVFYIIRNKIIQAVDRSRILTLVGFYKSISVDAFFGLLYWLKVLYK